VVAPLARGVARLGGLVEEPPAVEQFVKAVEACVTDSLVARDIVAKMPAMHITFVNAPAGSDPSSKKLTFASGGLVWTGVLTSGRAGVLTQDDVETFFELNFFARERDLVNRCLATTLPDALQRIKAATGRRDFRLDFDLPRILSSVQVCRSC
jgi:hypothetical protein